MKALNLLIRKRVKMFITLLLLSTAYCLHGQEPGYLYFYRVYLKDKGENDAGKYSASDLLSTRAINRRKKAGFADWIGKAGHSRSRAEKGNDHDGKDSQGRKSPVSRRKKGETGPDPLRIGALPDFLQWFQLFHEAEWFRRKRLHHQLHSRNQESHWFS